MLVFLFLGIFGCEAIVGSSQEAQDSEDAVTYSLSFDSNGATGGEIPPQIDLEFGSAIEITNPGLLIREGYTFLGWNTAADGSGVCVFTTFETFAPIWKLMNYKHLA